MIPGKTIASAVAATLMTVGTLMAQTSGSANLKTKVDPGRAGVFVEAGTAARFSGWITGSFPLQPT